eukprot:scaffold54280_cov17-Tisochrysis_lutea.AAC.1
MGDIAVPTYKGSLAEVRRCLAQFAYVPNRMSWILQSKQPSVEAEQPEHLTTRCQLHKSRACMLKTDHQSVISETQLALQE